LSGKNWEKRSLFGEIILNDNERIQHNKENKELLKKKLFIFDQDGTIYIDFEPLPFAKEIIEHIVKRGNHFAFLTNNSSKSTFHYKQELSKILDRDLSMDNVFTSTLATVDYLKSNNLTRVFPIGTPEFEEELASHGIQFTDSDPQIVVVGFDLTLTYDKIKKACIFVQNGIDYIATHPDKTCPTNNGYIPDTGSFIALIESATGIKPKKVLGKPNPEIIFSLLKKFNMSSHDAIIFGDRLYTDMQMGKNAKITTALMLTGETKLEDIGVNGNEPDFIFKDFRETLKLLREI
jgi:HAD superfamily hydrolase (TIGR01450 family)